MLAAALTFGGAARAQAPLPKGSGQQPTASAADLEAMFVRAGDAFNSGRYEEALAGYRRIWEARQTFDVAANLAQTELKLGRRSDAARHLSFALTSFPITGPREQREKMEERMASLRRDVSALRVSVDVAGAEVVIDGEVVGTAPLDGEVFVEPGQRVLEVRAPGYEATRRVLELSAGSSGAVEIALTRLPEAPASRAIAPVPARPASPASAAELSAPRTSAIPMIVGGVVGVGLVATAVGLTAATNAKDTEAEEQLARLRGVGVTCPGPVGCAELKEMREAKDTLHAMSVAAYAGAGIALVGTGGYLIHWLSRRDAARVGLRPAVVATPAVQGVWLSGAF